MTTGEEHGVSEAALFRALRSGLPDGSAMANRVRERLVEKESTDRAVLSPRPQGSVLRFADWIGMKDVAVSMVGPLLLPLGMARAGTAGTLVAKGVLPKSLLSTLALPFALLMAIGLTLHLSLRKTSDLQADRNLAAELREARLKWWADHQVAVGAFCGLMLLLSLVSYSSARVVIALVAIVAHALCAETLSSGRRASRQAIATTAFAIGWTAHTTAWFAGTVTSGASGFLSEGLARQGPHGFVLELAVTAWSSTLLGLASVQGRSRFLRPWRLMIKGTHLDIAKLVFTAFAPLATLGLIAAIWFYARSLDGSVGKQLWDSRASLAWFAFCIHALILVKRAPVVRPDESPSSP